MKFLLCVVVLFLFSGVKGQSCPASDGFYYCSDVTPQLNWPIPDSQDVFPGWQYGCADDFVNGVELPFTFYYYNIPYTTIYISTNGFVGFDSNTNTGCCTGLSFPVDPNAFQNEDFWDPWSTMNNVIAGWWMDLYGCDAVWYSVVGTEPSRTAIISFINTTTYLDEGLNTFQINLYEGTNNIQLHLIDIHNSHSDECCGPHIGSIGIGDDSGNFGMTIFDSFEPTFPIAFQLSPNSGLCGNGNIDNGEQCDGGSCCSPNCTFIDSTTVCRTSVGVCDITEYCTGEDADCPDDSYYGPETPCDETFGVCDVTINTACSGESPICSGVPIPSLVSQIVKWNDYNVISFGGVVANTGAIGGRVATKLDFSAGNGLSIGYDLETIDNDLTGNILALIVGEDATWGDGELYPDDQIKAEYAFVGNTFSGPSYLQARIIANDTTIGGTLDSDFENARSYYAAISEDLALQDTNVNWTVQYSGLFLTCWDPEADYYTLTIDGEVFVSISWWDVENCNYEATWLFNVIGTDEVRFVGGSFPGVAERILFNILGEGRDIFVQAGVIGSILAPNNYFTQVGGNVLGIIIAGDVLYISSVQQPICSNFRSYGIDTYSSDNIPAGSNSISVVSFNAFNVGDDIVVGGDGDTTITGFEMVDGTPTITIDPATTNSYPTNTNIHGNVPGNSTRNTPTPTIVTTSSSNGAVALAISAVALLIALFA